MRRTRLPLLLVAVLAGAHAPAFAGQPLETETARLAPRGTLAAEFGMERQGSRDGSELAIPLAVEYSLLDRCELLVEPVAYSNIRDPHRSLASGAGDLEVTAIALAAGEGRLLPALALAGEVKLPTARSHLIGSGQTDYTAYLVLSKRLSPWDLHANAGYTVIGQPPGVATQNVYSFALAAERRFGRFEAVGEVVGNTAALAENQPTASGESAMAPEIGSEELLATLGGRYRLTEAAALTLGLSVDNNHAFQVHPGLTVRFLGAAARP